MNDFQFNKKKQPHRSLDGFVVGGKKDVVRPNSLNSFNQYYKPTMRGNAPGREAHNPGPYKAIDGFTPSRQPFQTRPQATHEAEGFRSHNTHDDMATHDMVVPKPLQTHEGKAHAKPAKPKRRRLFFRKKRGEDHGKTKHGKKHFKLKVAGALAAVLLLIGGGLVLRGILLGNSIFKGGGNSALLNSQDVDPSQLSGEGDGRVNILMLGKGGAEQSDGPDLTDTIIIASIDPFAKEAALLSIPRDFWVKSPSGGQTKINQVYHDSKQAALNKYPYKERDSSDAKTAAEAAGIDAMEKVVSETMGVPIHYHVMIDFAGFRKAVDTVGGIDINVTEDMAVKENMWLAGKGSYNLNVPAGQQHFDGWRALAFTRSRKTSAGGDFARAERQRAVLVGLQKKILSAGTLANPVKLNQLMSDFSGNLSTNFSVNELLRLYDLTKEISEDKVLSAGLDELVVGDMVNNLSVQVPKAGLFNYTEIQSYVRNIMKDAFIRREDAKIIVLNGTTKAGLATTKSNELKSFGYNVISVGDAPTETYTKTVLVDLRSGSKKYTRNYLEKRFGVTAVGSLPDSNIASGEADFVIILGSDLSAQ